MDVVDDFYSKIELNKDWQDCADYLVERFGFEQELANKFTKIYAIDDNFNGYRKIILTMVKKAITEIEIEKFIESNEDNIDKLKNISDIFIY